MCSTGAAEGVLLSLILVRRTGSQKLRSCMHEEEKLYVVLKYLS